MPTTLANPRVSSSMGGTLTTGAGRAAGSTQVDHTDNLTPATGSSAGQVNKEYSAAFTITNNATPVLIDLTALTNPDGSALSFTRISAIKVSNDSAALGEDMTVGGGVNGLVATIPLPIYGGNNNGATPIASSSHLHWCAPNPGILVDATHKLVQIAVAAGTNVTGWITIIGR